MRPGAVSDLIRGLMHGAVALIVALMVVLAAPRWPRFANLIAVIALTADLALANAGLVVTVPQTDFDELPVTLDAIENAELASPDGGPFRVHRMQAWSPAGWSAADSERRLRDLLRWERETLQPGFGVPLGVEYTVAAESSIEDADYRPFFQPFPRPVDAQSMNLVMAQPGRPVLYYPRRRRHVDRWQNAALYDAVMYRRFRAATFSCHHPRRRVTQYSMISVTTTTAAAYWMPACAGMTAARI